MKHADGTTETLQLKHSFSAPQLEWFRKGSALNLFHGGAGEAAVKKSAAKKKAVAKAAKKPAKKKAAEEETGCRKAAGEQGSGEEEKRQEVCRETRGKSEEESGTGQEKSWRQEACEEARREEVGDAREVCREPQVRDTSRSL